MFFCTFSVLVICIAGTVLIKNKISVFYDKSLNLRIHSYNEPISVRNGREKV